MKGRCTTAALQACLVIATPLAHAAYPAGPVTIVVPYAAGGAVDLVARATAQSITGTLGQPVIIENRPGAGGNVAGAAVARAAADGHTLLMAGPANAAAPFLYDNLQYDPLRDLAPIVKIGSAPGVLLVANESPAVSVADLVRLARAKPDAMQYGHGGTGTTTEHLASEMFLSQADIRMQAIPYKGGAAAMTDLMAGRLTMVFTNLLNAVPQIENDRLRALGIASTERSPVLQDVPTLAEAGYPMQVSVWWGLMGPAGMPAEAVERINAAVNEALRDGALRQRLLDMKASPEGGTPQAFAQSYAAESQGWETTIRQAGIKGE
ncbi:tripartite tricarboxylate transporter substrate binding protein [Verticiella sediminum]|uniref:Tripartite tricarboxylate transporter substrate binding protein n=1 Tax=Verticiella sediminum TaxID=1247510 RepID=A0A556AJ09_9BURK|nr:tripartite tricarboxylate transporter substrate-binding protein [Verticiella sediminum]TSH92894.1 tripartite tricarboxylate transporter substrate binding protein [Verticiella sediminum]